MNKNISDRHFRKVYRADRNSRRIITGAGYSIIFSIFAILLFLIYQSIPLSFGASISLDNIFSWKPDSPKIRTVLIGLDQYQEVSYTMDEKGAVRFYQISDDSLVYENSLGLSEGEKILCASKGALEQELFSVGTNHGRIITGAIEMKPVYEGDTRKILADLRIDNVWGAEAQNDSTPAHVEKIIYRKNEDYSEFWVWVDHSGKVKFRIYDADDEIYVEYDLTSGLSDYQITSLTMSYNGENLIVGTKAGVLFWFDISDYENVKLKDRWNAFASPVSAVSYLLGNSSLAIGNANGEVQIWFPIRTPANLFKFRKIHEFDSHKKAVSQIYGSPRNRSFLTIDAGGEVHLNFSTTGKTELKFEPLQAEIQAASISPKSDGILVINNRNEIGHYTLHDPHPEKTLKTLFGKVHYEGYTKPEFVWQSTGGTDEFEPKLSLIPLIFGTLKGTLYAMFFSFPIAILAAIYVSQFAPYRLSRVVKPTVEIMAALPSVVIGFLAGLYFSPLFEKHLMIIFLIIIFLPVFFLLGLVGWRLVPEEKRLQVPVGWELFFSVPLIIVTFIFAFLIAEPLEISLFSGSITQWLYEGLGLIYDTRNSFVVGFALGFAVIPIIFTVSEDALSNVPESLTSASLALGASRWQTVRRIIIPAASGGIFAAVMLGFGRAVGETMIVLMATGNTPILDLSPFNGFRAMSACIAVEIPEAPVGGTLYRVLFLTALLLFMFTFLLNTISALIGDRLRKKYARF
jgi:phosphate transport system permease protein